jgi:hypothetical protein
VEEMDCPNSIRVLSMSHNFILNYKLSERFKETNIFNPNTVMPL